MKPPDLHYTLTLTSYRRTLEEKRSVRNAAIKNDPLPARLGTVIRDIDDTLQRYPSRF